MYVKVETGKEEFKIEKATYPKIYLKSRPEKGKANSELISELENRFDTKVALVSGHKSSRKKIKSNLSKSKMKSKLYGE